jgi:hypothetical protein
MHVHASHTNPYAQLDAMHATQKAAGKRAAERTRRKLLEFASEIAGEADSEPGVVKLGEREGSQEETTQEDKQTPRSQKKQADRVDAEAVEKYISDWAQLPLQLGKHCPAASAMRSFRIALEGPG